MTQASKRVYKSAVLVNYGLYKKCQVSLGHCARQGALTCIKTGGCWNEIALLQSAGATTVYALELLLH